METHVKVLGILNIAAGVISLCFALLFLVVFGGVAGAVGTSADPDAAIAAPIIGLTGMTLVVFSVAMALPALLIGWGLYRFRPWARVGGIVLAIVSLMAFPIGTILGVYGLWVLLSRDGAALFGSSQTIRS